MTLLTRLLCASLLALSTSAAAQELRPKVTINRSKVSNTKGSVFESLEKTLLQFLGEKQWTSVKYKEDERIDCSFVITVNTYSETDNSFTCTALISASRPVYGSSYSTTFFSVNDPSFNFRYQEYDPVEYNPDNIDNNLTAMLAYYAYMIIGCDMDTFSPQGGTAVLQTAEQLLNDVQNLGYPGWKPFDDNKNRHAILTDYLDGAMEPYRNLQYEYYRCGLDSMNINTDTGRKHITAAVMLLGKAREAKSMSYLPQLFTEVKRDELINIYKGQGQADERQKLTEILSRINPSFNNYWDEMKK